MRILVFTPSVKNSVLSIFRSIALVNEGMEPGILVALSMIRSLVSSLKFKLSDDGGGGHRLARLYCHCCCSNRWAWAPRFTGHPYHRNGQCDNHPTIKYLFHGEIMINCCYLV